MRLVVAVVAVVAAATLVGAEVDHFPSVAIAHFVGTHCADDATLRRVERVVGYRCEEIVDSGGLLLYFGERRDYDRFAAHLGDVFDDVESLAATRRCADLSVFDESSATGVEMQGNASVSLKTEFGGGGGHHHHHSPKRSSRVAKRQVTTSSVALRLVMHHGASPFDDELERVRAVADGRATARAIDNEPLIELVDIRRDDVMRLAEDLMEAVGALCHIEPLVGVETLNLWSTSTVQVATAMSPTNIGAADACSDAVCRPLWAAGLRGAGELIAISDTGLSTGACHFVDGGASVPQSLDGSVPADTGHSSVRAYWRGTGGDFVDSNGHGTHVTGTALGRAAPSSASSELDAADFDGAAPDARVVFIDVEASGGALIIPSPYDTQLLAFAYAAGARIHSGSWGLADWQYTDEDRRIDLFCWQRRDFVAIFAAGNSGGSRGAASILSPALAKNALAVGAAMNGFSANDIASGQTPSSPASAYAYDRLATFSSRGGASQQPRWRKPDVVASGGAYVWSASSTSPGDCSVVGATVDGQSGTSMASPNIAGAVALTREYFVEGRYAATPLTPRGSLLRAVVIGATTPLVGVFASVPRSSFETSSTYAPYGFGWLEGAGRVSLTRALPLSSYNTSALGVLSNENHALTAANQVDRYCVQVVGAGLTFPLDVVVALVYTDYPSSTTDSRPSVVNDLDVVVYADSSSTPRRPNGLTTRDANSPVEVVRTTTSSGRLRIEVSAAIIRFSSQNYALIVAADSASARILIDGAEAPGNIAAVPRASTSGACNVCSSQSFRSSSCSSQPTNPPPTIAPPSTSPPTIAPPTIAPPTIAPPSTSPPTNSPPTIAPPTIAPPTIAPPSTSPPTNSPPAPSTCALSVEQAMSALPTQYLDDDDDRVCCESPDETATRYADGAAGSGDPRVERLRRQWLTAEVNRRRGVAMPPLIVRAVGAARLLLDAHCVDGFVELVERAEASRLERVLDTYNAGTCSQSGVRAPSEACVVEQQRANWLYCSESGGTYSFDDDTCQCASERHQSGRCESLECGGNGASLASSSANAVDECVCFRGWSGGQCRQCSAAPSSSTRYLCVGLVAAELGGESAALRRHTHALRLVSATELADRLDGSYYADGQSTRAADRVPGTGSIDCRCSSTPLGSGDAASHADAATEALDYDATSDAAYALAAPTARRDSTGIDPTPQPTAQPTSGAPTLLARVNVVAAAVCAGSIALIF